MDYFIYLFDIIIHVLYKGVLGFWGPRIETETRLENYSTRKKEKKKKESAIKCRFNLL